MLKKAARVLLKTPMFFNNTDVANQRVKKAQRGATISRVRVSSPAHSLEYKDLGYFLSQSPKTALGAVCEHHRANGVF